ncbi:MAG: hypothetical protein HY925_15915 [Elusimicrobia bacterium]|nr:hypothetical protein [Elusimicrobiota bacterium]
MRVHRLFAAAVLGFVLCRPAFAKDPIVIVEANGSRAGYGREGIIQFAKDYELNPRTLTLEVLSHPFNFNVLAGAGANVTSFQFVSSELGINETFNGANTAAIISAFKDYLKSSGFLEKFVRLINTGAGAQLSGGPTSTIGMVVKQTFHDQMFSQVRTLEQRTSNVPPGTDPSFSGGFAQFSTDGFGGKAFSFTPGFTLDFGAKKDKKLKFSIPLSQIDLEGLKTYRAGLGIQYLYPVYLPDGWTWTVGPGLSYTGTVSLDLPNYTGLIGGAMSTGLQKDWTQTFAGVAAYYGRFNNLGGLNTNIQANIFGWGTQVGYRLGQRWVTALQLVGLHERVAGFQIQTYHTLGTAFSYKILNKFDLTFSISKLMGLPKQRYLDFGLGSAWFF